MISSRQNALIKQLHSLKNRPGRSKSGLFLVEGVRLIEEALAAAVAIEYAVYSSHLEGNKRGQECLAALVGSGIEPHLISDNLLCELADTERPQGIIIAARLPKTLPDDDVFWQQGNFWLIIDGVQDPGNLGTILRTAEAFGADRVVALKGTVDPYNEKVIRSAMGAIFRLPLLSEENSETVLTNLKQQEVQIIVSALTNSVPYDQISYAPRLALVIGNEGAGVSSIWMDAADLVVQIPIAAQAESLNVAVATGIMLAKISQIK